MGSVIVLGLVAAIIALLMHVLASERARNSALAYKMEVDRAAAREKYWSAVGTMAGIIRCYITADDNSYHVMKMPVMDYRSDVIKAGGRTASVQKFLDQYFDRGLTYRHEILHDISECL